MLGKAQHSLRALASGALLAGLIATVAWTTPASAASPVGGLLNGAGNAVANQSKPVGETAATVVSQPVPSSAVTAPSTPSVLADASSPPPSAASPPSSAALRATSSIVRASASSPSHAPRSSAAAQPVNRAAGTNTRPARQITSAAPSTLRQVQRTTTGAVGQITSAAPSTLKQVQRTIGGGTIVRQVTRAGGRLASSLRLPPASPSSLLSVASPSSLLSVASLSSLLSVARLSPPGGLPLLPVLPSPAPLLGSALIAVASAYGPTGGGIGSSATPVSAWVTFTAPSAPSRWSLPPPRQSSTNATGPTAVAATSVLAGSSATMAATPSAGALAPVNAPPALPASGFSSLAGSSSGFALSLFLLLAGLLALGAPWARRLLRPSARPRRPAPFVLIPERPG